MAAFRSLHAPFFMLVPLVPWETQYACTQSSTLFSRPLSVARRKRDACRSAFLVRVLLSFSTRIVYLYRSGGHEEQEPGTVPLKCRTNDFPVPSYLADVFQKPEGWIETSQVAADEQGSHTVYAIDCEMVRIVNACNPLK